MFELDACVDRSEAPVDCGFGMVASKHEGGKLMFEGCHVWDASVGAACMH